MRPRTGDGGGIELSVIVPFFNDRAVAAPNLAALAGFLRAQPWSWEIIAVDDGSGDGTAGVLLEIAAAIGDIRVLRARRNMGKGAAVGAAMRAAGGERLLFIDGDLPFSLDGMALVARALDGADIAIASRNRPHPEAARFTTRLRGRLSLAFSALARRFLLPDIKDTQAGLKGFRRGAAESILERQFCARFCFDLEALVVAKRQGLSVAQVELAWRNDEDSSIRLLRDGFGILVDFLGVLWRESSGAYEKPHPPRWEAAFVEAG